MYGWAGARYSSSLGATSQSLPRYITATRSLMFFTTARSWAMKISVRPCCLEVLEQVEDLRLDADVERRHRLVADDQARVEDERAGDRDALALAAGELVGLALGRPRRVDADLLQRLVDDLARARPWCPASRC